ncbi:hypothetical protein [Wolbachia endosymbiont of Armadillidium arcangelii]|uniref:Uncharacterized protein n=1 Tax=Wolbachia endosymbiont of Armadillidium arcangelii TaxID=3158571 RepID=A0AAU7Q1N1_9RICK
MKEIQDFIKGPKRAEDEKELESKVEPKISNLIDFSDHHEIGTLQHHHMKMSNWRIL